MSTDDDLEILKMRKLLELQKKMLLSKSKKMEKQPTIDFSSLFYKSLTDDGREMFEKAKAQYPALAERVANEIGKLIYFGRIRGMLDSQVIYGIFYELGYPIRIQTKIVYKKKGKVKSISELIRGNE